MQRWIILIFSLSLALTVQAGPITYQGQLQDDGSPANTQVDLEFALYDQDEGGSPLASDSHDDVVVTDGLFQVELDFGTGAFDGGERWLEVIVDGQALDKRQLVTAAPSAQFALAVASDSIDSDQIVSGAVTSAKIVAGAVGASEVDSAQIQERVSGTCPPDQAIRVIDGDGNVNCQATGDEAIWEVDGNDTFYTDGNVGIGTDIPASDLQVQGRFVSGGSTNIASGGSSAAVGGVDNVADALFSFVGGGDANEAGGSRSFIGGGASNEANGDRAFIAGGILNVAEGTNSFAGGNRASALHDASFVWGDSSIGRFESSADDQFLVRAGGGVGINTNEPEADLHVMGDTAIGNFDSDARLSVGTDNPWTTLHVVSNEGNDPLRVMVGDNSAENTAIRAYAHGGVSIGDSLPDTYVHERGLTVHGRGSFGSTVLIGQLSSQEDNDLCIRTNGILSDCSSSERYKENVAELEAALEMVRDMRPVRYNWIESGNEDIGMIAEEMKEIAPEIVHYNDDGEISGFQYSRLGAILAGAIQELDTQADHELTKLRKENEHLRSQLAELREQVADNSRLADRNAELEDRLARLEEVLLEGRQLADGVH